MSENQKEIFDYQVLRLKAISEKLQQENLSLDVAKQLFEEGNELYVQISSYLEDLKRKADSYVVNQ